MNIYCEEKIYCNVRVSETESKALIAQVSDKNRCYQPARMAPGVSSDNLLYLRNHVPGVEVSYNQKRKVSVCRSACVYRVHRYVPI